MRSVDQWRSSSIDAAPAPGELERGGARVLPVGLRRLEVGPLLRENYLFATPCVSPCILSTVAHIVRKDNVSTCTENAKLSAFPMPSMHRHKLLRGQFHPSIKVREALPIDTGNPE